MERKQHSKAYRNRPKIPSQHRIVIFWQLVGLGVELWICSNEDSGWRELIVEEEEGEGVGA